MSVKILLIGARLCRNLGGPSLLTTTMSVLDEFFQDTEYTFISPTSEDLPLAETLGVRIIPVPSLKKLGFVVAALTKAFLGITLGSRYVREVIDAFVQTDIVIDIRGIDFSDSVGRNTFVARASRGTYFLLAKLFRKPVVKYTADLGPFESRWNRLFARLYLKYTLDLILARSDVTRKRLEKLGVTTPIRVCPDTAFLLEAHTTKLAEDLSKQKADSPIVGFSVSWKAAHQSNNPEIYLRSMAALADYAVKSIGAKIVLIPNEFSADKALDDVYIARETLKKMEKNGQAIIVSENYTAQQFKGIIRQCDVVIASRYHTIIASLSQAIPVLAVGWHAKYPEVLRLVGQEQYFCSVESLDFDVLKEKFDQLWQSRDDIRKEISSVLPEIREAILRGGEEVSFLLSKG